MIVLGCKLDNSFVKVEYFRGSGGVNISCIFQDNQDNSSKSCIIRYGLCGQNAFRMYNTVQAISNPESVNIVTLQLTLDSQLSNRTFCYNITASNDTFTVIVEGQISKLRISVPKINVMFELFGAAMLLYSVVQLYLKQLD